MCLLSGGQAPGTLQGCSHSPKVNNPGGMDQRSNTLIRELLFWGSYIKSCFRSFTLPKHRHRTSSHSLRRCQMKALQFTWFPMKTKPVTTAETKTLCLYRYHWSQSPLRADAKISIRRMSPLPRRNIKAHESHSHQQILTYNLTDSDDPHHFLQLSLGLASRAEPMVNYRKR